MLRQLARLAHRTCVKSNGNACCMHAANIALGGGQLLKALGQIIERIGQNRNARGCYFIGNDPALASACKHDVEPRIFVCERYHCANV